MHVCDRYVIGCLFSSGLVAGNVLNWMLAFFRANSWEWSELFPRGMTLRLRFAIGFSTSQAICKQEVALLGNTINFV